MIADGQRLPWAQPILGGRPRWQGLRLLREEIRSTSPPPRAISASMIRPALPQSLTNRLLAHCGQEFESDEASQEAALAEACDLLRVGHTLRSIVGPHGDHRARRDRAIFPHSSATAVTGFHLLIPPAQCAAPVGWRRHRSPHVGAPARHHTARSIPVSNSTRLGRPPQPTLHILRHCQLWQARLLAD